MQKAEVPVCRAVVPRNLEKWPSFERQYPEPAVLEPDKEVASKSLRVGCGKNRKSRLKFFQVKADGQGQLDWQTASTFAFVGIWEVCCFFRYLVLGSAFTKLGPNGSLDGTSALTLSIPRFVQDAKWILWKPRYLALDTWSRRQISLKQFRQRWVIRTQKKLLSYKNHLKVFHSSDNSLHFQFLSCVVAVRPTQTIAKETDRVFEADVIKLFH